MAALDASVDGESVDKGNMHMLVAVDGSPGAVLAFEFACALARVKRGDRVTVVHIADPAKDYLPHEMRPSSIETFYSTRCVTQFPSGTWRVVVQDKRAGQSTRDALMGVLNAKGMEADLLCVGFTGRKGPKADPTVLGSSADFSLRSGHVTAAVVKRKPFPTAPTALFIVGVDGSDRAQQALTFVLQLRRPGDVVHIVHVDEGATSVGGASSRFRLADITGRYDALVAATKDTTFKVLSRVGHMSVADVMVSYADEAGADVVAVGVDGLGAYAAGRPLSMGSNSDLIVRKAPCSVIAYQPKHGTYSSTSTPAVAS